MKSANKQTNSSNKSASKKLMCCICGEPIPTNPFGWEFGNNAYPYGDENNNRCCDECNWNIVVPTRIEISLNSNQ